MAEHTCIHEEQLQEQSVTIGKLSAEMTYKREKLDDLKEDNRRMEKKIDDLSKDISDFISQSDSKDSALNERLKTIEQNYNLLAGLVALKSVIRSDGTPAPLLVGISRKSMVYKYLNITPEESLPATQALHMVALQNGTDILRVHDVAEALRTIKLYKALATGSQS